MLALFILFFSSAVFSFQKKLPPFQKVLNDCFSTDFSSEKISSIPQLYNVIEKKFSLSSSVLLEREVLFKEKDDTRKLKFAGDQWALYRVQDDETLVAIDNGARQKNHAVELTLSQLLIHATVKSDWTKTKEVRSGQRIVTLSRQDAVIKTLQFQIWGQKKSLECAPKEGSDICSCFDLK